MVATQNIEILGPIWTFSLKGVLTVVVNGLDINGCVLNGYFSLKQSVISSVLSHEKI